MASSAPASAFSSELLPTLGWPAKHHAQAFAQQGALARAGLHSRHRVLDGGELAARVGFFQEVDFFFRKVQRGFHQHAQRDDAFGQRIDFLGKHTAQRQAGRPGCRFGTGVDQVGHGFGLGQVQLVVQKGPLGEFSRRGQTQALGRTGFQATRQQQLQYHRAAVGLQLQHVFAGVAVGRREVQRQPLVDGLAIGVKEGPKRACLGTRGPRTMASIKGRRSRPRCAHDAYRAPARCGGDGNDGVLVVAEHEHDCQPGWRGENRRRSPPGPRRRFKRPT